MTYELGEIRYIRKRLGLTQAQLSGAAKVSQSLIAKIESGRLDPAYSKAQKIFAALEELSHKQESKALELMSRKIIEVSPSDTVQDAIKKMKQYEISQLPVIEDHKLVGLISEAALLDAVIEGKTSRIKDVMIDPPPVVTGSTTASVVSGLLKFYPMVVVTEKGKVSGVITRSDILRNL